MRENTGPVQVGEPRLPPVVKERVTEYPRYRYAREKASGSSLSRDTWVKLIIWITPIIFAAGALYYSIGSMADRVKGVEGSLSAVKEAQSETMAEQRVFNVQIQAIREDQAHTKIQIEKVDEKIDSQKDDLSAIKAKLGIRRRSR